MVYSCLGLFGIVEDGCGWLGIRKGEDKGKKGSSVGLTIWDRL